MGLGRMASSAGQGGRVARVENPLLARCCLWVAGVVLAFCLGPKGLINLFGALSAGYKVAEGCWHGDFVQSPQYGALAVQLQVSSTLGSLQMGRGGGGGEWVGEVWEPR